MIYDSVKALERAFFWRLDGGLLMFWHLSNADTRFGEAFSGCGSDMAEGLAGARFCYECIYSPKVDSQAY
jgi:hypothetical protein